MSAEEWSLINTIFEGAIALPEGQRVAYVEEKCRNCTERAAIVLGLLEDDAQSGDTGVSQKHSAPVLADGEWLGERFRIVHFIARGGMGEVYEAYDEKLKTPVAVKVLSAKLTADPEAVARFRREIRIARELRHENLCAVYDLFEHREKGADIRPCLTMELFDGENLSQYLSRSRPLPADEAYFLARQIGDALDALHRHGVIHRDLKPANIILANQRGKVRVVVTDFGLAKDLEGASELFESRFDSRPGSPYFMAPELFAAGGEPGVASDIYAFGLVIDEMVTSSRAFAVESQAALYYAKLREGPVPPSRRNLSAPHWESVILRCLETDPARRYASAGAVVAALRRESVFGRLPSRRVVMAGLIGLPAAGGALAITAVALQPVATSMIVFPIENQTSSAEYRYFCTGTTAELMRRLSHLDGMRVIPYYEPKSMAPPSLKGRFSLQGLMQGYQTQIRLTIQLIDNERGELVWSDSFDRQKIDNPLELQSEIARATVDALTTRVLWDPSTKSSVDRSLYSIAHRLRRVLAFQNPSAPPTASIAALDLYMRGRHLLEEMSPAPALAAINQLQKAVDQDPDFALAWSALADAQMVLMEFNYAPDAELLSRARGFAEKAVMRGPRLPEAHASLAAVEQNSWQWEASERRYRESLRLNPKFARARRWYAGLIIQFGRFEEALEQVRDGMDLDPYDYSAYPGYGLYLFCAGKNEEAISVLERAISEKPLVTAQQNLGNIYAKLGSVSTGPAAARYFQKAFALADRVAGTESAPERGVAYSDRMYALYFALARNAAEAQPYLDRLTRDMEAGHTSPVVVAWIHTALGQYETALNLLERALVVKDRKLLNIKVHPLLEPLREMGRFQSVLRAMRL
jgi:serine/threonine-protein kinase